MLSETKFNESKQPVPVSLFSSPSSISNSVAQSAPSDRIISKADFVN